MATKKVRAGKKKPAARAKRKPARVAKVKARAKAAPTKRRTPIAASSATERAVVDALHAENVRLRAEIAELRVQLSNRDVTPLPTASEIPTLPLGGSPLDR